MPNGLDEWVLHLKDKPLPILGHTAKALQDLRLDENTPLPRFTAIAIADPGLALQLLRLANNARQRHLHSEVATVEHAAMMLGLRSLQEAPFQLPLLESSVTGPARDGWWRTVVRSYHGAYQAYEWARNCLDPMSEEIFTTALLHEIGELALWAYSSEQLQTVDDLVLGDNVPRDEAEYVVLGCSLQELTAALAQQWSLPLLLRQSLNADHAHDRRVYGVMLATQFARAVERRWDAAAGMELTATIGRYLEMPAVAMRRHLIDNAVSAARETAFYEAPHAAALLTLLPATESNADSASRAPAAQSERTPTRHPPVPAPVSARAHASARSDAATPLPRAGDPPNANAGLAVDGIEHSGREQADHTFATSDAPTHVCLMPQPSLFGELVGMMQDKIVTGVGLNELMSLAMQALHEGAGLHRTVFALLTHQRAALQARFLRGTDSDPAFNRFALSLETPHLFTLMMQKPQSVWVNEQNCARLWGLVPEEVRTLIKTNSFFSMSVFVASKPVGLFYADRHSAGCHLDTDAYERFRQVCRLVATGMSVLSAAGVEKTAKPATGGRQHPA